MPDLTERQLKGFACAVCGYETGSMQPMRGYQLFAHPSCLDGLSDDQVEDLDIESLSRVLR